MKNEKILREKQWAAKPGLDCRFVFQHDSDQKYTSLLVKNYLQKTKVKVHIESHWTSARWKKDQGPCQKTIKLVQSASVSCFSGLSLTQCPVSSQDKNSHQYFSLHCLVPPLCFWYVLCFPIASPTSCTCSDLWFGHCRMCHEEFCFSFILLHSSVSSFDILTLCVANLNLGQSYQVHN